MSAWIATSNEATSERMNCVFHFLQLSSLWMSLPQSPSSSSSSSSSSVAIVYRILMCSVSYVLPPFCCQHAQALIRTLSWHPGRMRVLPKWVGLCPDIVINSGSAQLSQAPTRFWCVRCRMYYHRFPVHRFKHWVGLCPGMVVEYNGFCPSESDFVLTLWSNSGST